VMLAVCSWQVQAATAAAVETPQACCAAREGVTRPVFFQCSKAGSWGKQGS